MPQKGYQISRIQLWKSYGVNVVISTDNILTENGVKNLLEKANAMGPVSAVFNLAVVCIIHSLTDKNSDVDF